MIFLSMVCGLAFATDTAADFFPLVPGTVRTYESKTGDNAQLVDKVGDALDVGGPKVYPVTESSLGGTPNTTYYRLDPDQVLIYANDPKHPLPTPMPILKLGSGKTEWQISGSTMTGPAGERLIGHGEARASGQRTVLGKKVDVIEVKLAYEVGVGLSALMYDQTAIYGKGVGLVELTTKMRLGKGKPNVSTYKLVSIESPKGATGGAF